MLYPKNKEASLSPELFRDPTAEYRGTPFWAWDGKLDDETLKEQIGIFKEMGLGGFHMHVRTGLEDPYLTDSFMDRIRTCVEEAKQKNMLAYLYDEDRWPSGTAGGKVTDRHPEFARRQLLFTAEPYTPERPYAARGSEPGRGQNNQRQDNGDLLAVYDIELNGNGTLKGWTRIDPETEKGQSKDSSVRWYAYREYSTDDPWFNDHPYADTLNPAAIRRFMDLTHEAYAERFGGDFGRVIPSIFTDEPQFAPKKALNFAKEKENLILPWTDALPDLFRERCGYDLLDRLPELFWEREDGKLPKVRWDFQNLVTDRFVESFPGQIGAWCDQHGLSLTGHVMNEPTLYSQTLSVGSAMRCYAPFGIPGIDMLCDHHEFTTAKQTQSRVRQLGKEGMLSELYGVTGWDYDFRGYKLQGDWQACLGVTVRVPHLAWETMHGEAKRDYPASISYQSPWWKKYAVVEDHFGRLNTALTRGTAVCRVAILHPIESYWLLWGPNDQTADRREQMDAQFLRTAEILLKNQMDFDYVEEASLALDLAGERARVTDGALQYGSMRYEAIVIPPVLTLRSSTLEMLKEFAARGGRLLVQGDCPEYLDAEYRNRHQELEELYEKADHVGVAPENLLKALEAYRFADVRQTNGSRCGKILMQHRLDGDGEWLFLCNGENPESPDRDEAPELKIILNGNYGVTEYDTLSGEIRPMEADHPQEGKTVLKRTWHMHDSLLLRLEKNEAGTAGTDPRETDETASGSETWRPCEKTVNHAGPVNDGDLSGALEPAHPQTRFGQVPVTLEEPNMLLLDEAEWKMNDGPWQAEEELLRIDNYARETLGIPLRLKEVAQPYTIAPVKADDRLYLRFRFESNAERQGIRLAMEDTELFASEENTGVRLNGEEIPVKTDGWYVDKCIRTMPLPALRRGENILEVQVPIGPNTNLEYMYLLGDFSVRLHGTEKELAEPVRKLGWGDISRQDLPFYTGNLDYKVRVRANGPFEVRVPHYRGGLVEVLLDGVPAGNVVFSPYRLRIEAVPGEHEVTFRLYGTRQNGFAQLHYTPGVVFYQSPNSWRSSGDLWSYEYHFKPAGILKSPEFCGCDVLQADGSVRPGDRAITMKEKS